MVRRAGLCTTLATLALAACGSDPGAGGSSGANAVTSGAGAGAPAASGGSGAPAVSAAGTGGASSAGRAAASASTAGASAGAPAAAGSSSAAGSGGDGAAGVMAAAAGSAAAAGATAPASSGSGLKPVTSIAEDGPYATTVDMEADGGDGYLVYPTDLGADGVKHPIFVWGTGSGSIPMQYNMHLVRLASHGFVVYSADTSSVTGALLTQGIDYLFTENEREGSPLYQKLDTSKLASAAIHSGHSAPMTSPKIRASPPRFTSTAASSTGWAARASTNQRSSSAVKTPGAHPTATATTKAPRSRSSTHASRA